MIKIDNYYVINDENGIIGWFLFDIGIWHYASVDEIMYDAPDLKEILRLLEIVNENSSIPGGTGDTPGNDNPTA